MRAKPLRRPNVPSHLREVPPTREAREAEAAATRESESTPMLGRAAAPSRGKVAEPVPRRATQPVPGDKASPTVRTPVRLVPAIPARSTPKPPPRHLRAVPPLPPGHATPIPVLPTDPDHIPAPTPNLVCALAVQGFQMLEGERDITQLGPLVSVQLARELVKLRALRRDRERVNRDERRRSPHATGVRITQVGPGVVEASVVLDTGVKAYAVALRLEWVHRHWRACELFVL